MKFKNRVFKFIESLTKSFKNLLKILRNFFKIIHRKFLSFQIFDSFVDLVNLIPYEHQLVYGFLFLELIYLTISLNRIRFIEILADIAVQTRGFLLLQQIFIF